MKALLSIFFSTLVLSISSLAVQEEKSISPASADAFEDSNTEVNKNINGYDFDLSTPKPPPVKETNIIKRNPITSDHSAGVALGIAKDIDASSSLFRIHYRYNKSSLPLEYSLDIYRKINSFFSIRYQAPFEYFESWDTYYAFGLAINLVPNQGIASPFHVYNYHSSMGLGLERFQKSNLKLSHKVDWIWGRKYSVLQASIAYTWFW